MVAVFVQNGKLENQSWIGGNR